MTFRLTLARIKVDPVGKGSPNWTPSLQTEKILSSTSTYLYVQTFFRPCSVRLNIKDIRPPSCKLTVEDCSKPFE